MAKIRVRLVYLIIAIAMLVVFLPGYTKFMELRARNIYLEKEIEKLEEENVRLYKEKKMLEEDLDYVEKVARDSMGVAREDELQIKIEEQDNVK